MYSLNFKLLASRLLPSFLKGPVIQGYIKSLISPLQYVNGLFTAFLSSTKEALSYNSQVIVLQYILQRQFGAGILIIDAEAIAFDYGYFATDGQPSLAYGYFKSDHQPALGYGYFSTDYDSLYHFYIGIPAALGLTDADKNMLLASAKRYALANKRYKIITI